MVKKIKNKKQQDKKFSKEEVEKMTDIGLNVIRTVCDEDVFNNFYLLHLDTSPVIIESFILINQAYRLKYSNLSLRSGEYMILRKNVTTFVENYFKLYQPSHALGLYSIYFIMNKWLHKYIKLNYYKKVFRKENNSKKDAFKEIYTLKNYSEFNKLFKLDIKKEDDIQPGYDANWMYEFKNVLELLKWNLVILDKYREKIYNKSILKKNMNIFLNSIIRNKDLYPPEIKSFFEYKLCINLENCWIGAKTLTESDQLFTEMKKVKALNIKEAESDYKYLKKSLSEISCFLDKYIYLLVTGETVYNPKIAKKSLVKYFKDRKKEIRSGGIVA